MNTKGNGVFSGSVSNENNGGFAMTRLSTDVKLNSKSTKIILRVKGDGKAYQLKRILTENLKETYKFTKILPVIYLCFKGGIS